MGALDPVVPTHSFAADPAATGAVNVSLLDQQLALLAGGTNAHTELLLTLLRNDGTLRDQLIRLRNLHPEVSGALALIVQSAVLGGRMLTSCRVASTGNLTQNGPQTIDGIACIAGDVVLCKDQTPASLNGIWQVNAGAWTRVATADTYAKLVASFVWVDQGLANEGSGWACTATAGGTINVDPLAFTLIYRAAWSLANLDPSAVPTATADAVADYLLLDDVSAGAMRRVLISALPYLAASTTHAMLAGLSANDHPQYLRRDGVGAVTANLNLGAQLIVNSASPVSAGDLANKAYVDATARAQSGFPAGFLGHTAATAAPAGWLVRDGSAVSRTDYANLFAAIGTTYGVGDGSTTFNLPNALGRFDLGSGSGAGLTTRVVGATGGEEAHILTIAEIPAHHHTNGVVIGGSPIGASGSSYNPGVNTGDTGGGGSHNTMPPFIAGLPIIKT